LHSLVPYGPPRKLTCSLLLWLSFRRLSLAAPCPLIAFEPPPYRNPPPRFLFILVFPFPFPAPAFRAQFFFWTKGVLPRFYLRFGIGFTFFFCLPWRISPHTQPPHLTHVPCLRLGIITPPFFFVPLADDAHPCQCMTPPLLLVSPLFDTPPVHLNLLASNGTPSWPPPNTLAFRGHGLFSPFLRPRTVTHPCFFHPPNRGTPFVPFFPEKNQSQT